MNKHSRPNILAMGLALFSMFFGSGNLIFPLTIGYNSGELWNWASIGFIFTGVLLPFSGVIAMAVYEGDYDRFFATLGKTGGFIFTTMLLCAWIPLGSGPRCIILSFSNIQSYIYDTPLWLYSLIYSALIYLVTIKKSRALDLLGYILTPLLLACLGSLIYLGLSASPGLIATDQSIKTTIFHGIIEGYQTQDLIASFFFASSVIGILKTAYEKGISPIKVAVFSSIVGISLLAIVYISLILLAASSGTLLDSVSTDKLLATLVLKLLPKELAFIGSAAITLACFTTSIALTVVFSDFLKKDVFCGRLSEKACVFASVLICFCISLAGFSRIAAVISILMQVLYPILIGLIIWNLLIKQVFKKKREVKS
jgi:LIVCS family branched-chain amino acid:cation transporter